MSNRSWTDEQDARLKDLWGQGLSAAAIGRVMGVTKNAVVGRAHRLKLASRASPIFEHGPAWTDEQDAQLRALWGRGITTKAVARLMGRSASGVATRARRLDLPHSRNALWPRPAFDSSPRPPAATTRPRHPMAAPTAGAGATPSAVFREPPERAGLPPGLGAGASLSTRPAPVFVAPAPLPGGNERGCRWPLWGDERPTHLYCGEARRDLACPYCPTHAARAFQRVAPTGSLAAWNPAQRQFRRPDGQGNLTAGTRFYA